MKTYLLIAVCAATILHSIGTIVDNEQLGRQFRNIAFGIIGIVFIFIIEYMGF